MNNHRSFVENEHLSAPASASGAQPTQPEPRRCRRSSAVLIESAINGINILRRSLQDEIDSAEEEQSDWTISSPESSSGLQSDVSSGSADSSRLVLKKDAEADREFTKGLSKYLDSNESGATIHFSRTVEMRQAIQENAAAFALLFEDEAIRQRHERQLRHAKQCLDEMATKPADYSSDKKMADSALLEDFKRRNQTEDNSDDDSDYSLPMGYDELACDESSCGDSLLLDVQANRRLCSPQGYCTANCPPAMMEEDNDDAKCWQQSVKPIERSKSFADTDKLPEEIEMFVNVAKANSTVVDFNSSCVSDLCWNSVASFNMGVEESKDLRWAAANLGRAMAAEMKASKKMGRPSISRAA